MVADVAVTLVGLAVIGKALQLKIELIKCSAEGDRSELEVSMLRSPKMQ